VENKFTLFSWCLFRALKPQATSQWIVDEDDTAIPPAMSSALGKMPSTFPDFYLFLFLFFELTIESCDFCSLGWAFQEREPRDEQNAAVISATRTQAIDWIELFAQTPVFFKNEN
jgi:hypothetical protein